MIKRSISALIQELAVSRNKMVFISGPRQVGKTTLSKQLSKDFSETSYKNWDQDQVAKDWAKDAELMLKDFDLKKSHHSRLLILDEIHKSKNWKNKVKGLYDLHQDTVHFLVTGSARLNVYKKGGDSLLGRYLNFRLHPLTLGEVIGSSQTDPDLFLKAALKEPAKPETKTQKTVLQNLYSYSGFPEPFISENVRTHRIWKKDRRERIIKEDLRDLNRVQEISQLQTLALLLPEKVGSPLSIDSLREDLSTSHDSVKRWLGWFQELYIHFEIKPWSKNIKRALKKEGKIYLYDWTEVEESGPRFENLVASHLLKAVHFWTDAGYGEFDLFYIRNKEKEEIDFLIVKDRKPWLAIEAKKSNTDIDQKVFQRYYPQIDCPIVQLTMESDIFWKSKTAPFYSISAASFFSKLP